MDPALRRRFFAEEIEAVCRLRSARLVDAFASVPREAYLRPGPWTVLSDADFVTGMPAYRQTPDADPARVNHNIAVAIDPERQLFNGQPGTLAVWLDTLDLAPGSRVLHVGCGLGYYTAVMAHCAGARGRVLAIEADPQLALEARGNLSSMPWVEVRHGDAAQPFDERFDAIVVNAGVTHPLDGWLDALAPADPASGACGGRMILPLTATMAAMGPIGKGLVFVVTNDGSESAMSARVLSMVAIYSAVSIRDADLNDRAGASLRGGPAQWMAVKRLRRDDHEAAPSCWMHGRGVCFSTGAAAASV
jgi:protein-L-isoaspartate(D-aspartate) O-methyltransferase